MFNHELIELSFIKMFLQETLASWRKVWYVAIAIYLFDATFFVVFGSGKEQYWNTLYVDGISQSDASTPRKELRNNVTTLDQVDGNISPNMDSTYESNMPKIQREKLK